MRFSDVFVGFGRLNFDASGTVTNHTTYEEFPKFEKVLGHAFMVGYQ